MSEEVLWIHDDIPDLNIDSGDSLETLISTVEQVSNLVKQGNWKDVSLERDESVDPEYAVFYFRGMRPETKQERKTRLKIVEAMKARKAADKIAQEQRERKEYERLKKKFGD